MSYGAVRDDLTARLDELRSEGLYKHELTMTTPQGAHVAVEGKGELLNLCANNYLGLANHPEMVAAAHEALDRWGYGMASVRFICGTQALHRELEERLSTFLGTEDTILFSSCFDANGGVFEALLDERDAVISDQLNHASIIDGIRLCKARRERYANGDMEELEARLVATDGVFSMDGYHAKLDAICELADRYDALVLVDDSHAVGFVGPGGRGTHALHDVVQRVDVLTGTLGKAVGGASGGYVSGRREIVELLRQRARPYLFSNSLAPAVVGASLKALDLIERSDDLRERLAANTREFRQRMTEFGFDVLPGEHPIVPVMIGEAQQAAQFSAKLVGHGVFAVAFSYPVVPLGTARIRTQMSAAHTDEDLELAVEAFVAARAETAD
jgi:glycine C-acetyltransferase